MPDGLGVHIEGLPALKRKFSDLSDKGQRAALSTAMRKGGKVVQDEAKRRASFSKRIQRGLKVKTKVKRTSAEATVGFSGAGWIGVPWERGWVSRGGTHVAARPMLRPAIDENQGEILDAFRDALNDAIDKVKARGL